MLFFYQIVCVHPRNQTPPGIVFALTPGNMLVVFPGWLADWYMYPYAGA